MTGRRLLDGERVRLTAIRQNDIDTIISWDDDPEFMRMLVSDPSYPRPEIAQREWWAERLKERDQYHFAIRTQVHDAIIGTIHISEIEWPHGAGWLSIGIGNPEARGKGYGAEAMRLALDFAFDSLNLHRITLSVFAYNQRAIRTYESLGFTHEGVMREFLLRDGQRHDMHIYGMLAPEWRGSSQKARTGEARGSGDD